MNTDPLARDPESFASAFAPDEIKRELARNMIQQMGRDPGFATKQDWFYALAYFLRGRLSSSRVQTWRRNFANQAKWVYYFSLELLPGRMLKPSLISLGLLEPCRKALSDLGVDLDELWEFETEPALGNGGLGRLAACMLELMATLNYACFGYSIRYEYGMFRQKIENGEQVEHPENWLKNVNPWEYARPQVVYPIQFNGRVTQMNNWRGEILCHWSGTDDVMAVGYDLPVIGLDGRTISSVRLWSAKATEDFNLTYFNRGNYIDAVQEKSESETLSKVLYPSDTTSMGRELRLKQEYFLVSASLQDILSRFERQHDSFDNLPDHVAIQLNDTHPVLAIPELMRLLVDVYRLDWNRAWGITVRTFSFTNHTLLSEALEILAGRSDRIAAAAASADHLRDQSALPSRRHPSLPGQCRDDAAPLADRGERAQIGPHGEPGDRGQPQSEWRVAACTPISCGRRCSRISTRSFRAASSA